MGESCSRQQLGKVSCLTQQQTVGGITQLNDKLVAKVWEANEIATKATKKTRKLQQSQRVSTLARPTAASRAASISAANGSSTPGRSASISTKKTRAGSNTTRGSTPVKKEKRGSQLVGNNLELLRAANMGRYDCFKASRHPLGAHALMLA
jgi:hypothetical protein